MGWLFFGGETMPELTPNYQFKKPLGNENVTRLAYRENIDLLDAALGPTADPTLAPTGNGPGKLVQWVSWFANRIRAITGKANWWDTPATTLEAAKSHIDAAAPHSGHETPSGAQGKVNAHITDTMPHRFTDGSITYHWGLKVVSGILTMQYEEVM
jgi:hypothetical protein